MKAKVIVSDCVEAMNKCPDNSVESVVCDPPFGLEFLGKQWDSLDGDAWRSGAGFTKAGIGDRDIPWPSFGGGDSANATCKTCGGRMRGARKCSCDEPMWFVKGLPIKQSEADSRRAKARKMQDWHELWAAEAFRILKPGGYLIAMGGDRTVHRLTCAIEDVGFEIRNLAAHVFGTGFPKNLNVSKAIDKAFGAEREVVRHLTTGMGEWKIKTANHAHGDTGLGRWDGSGKEYDLTAPSTDLAKHWDGWGTSMKPAMELAVIARKPLVGTVVDNVLRFGTGAINIDGCRIETTESLHGGSGKLWSHYRDGTEDRAMPGPANVQGRWPANVAFDEAAAAFLDDMAGEHPGCKSPSLVKNASLYRPDQGAYQEQGPIYPGTGGPSRYFLNTVYDPVFDDLPIENGADRFLYTAKSSRRERNEGLSPDTEARLQLRSDLTDEQRMFVMAELEKLGLAT